MADAPFDVVGIGNAIVDVIAQSDDNDLARLDLNKGTMTLIDDAQLRYIAGRKGRSAIESEFNTQVMTERTAAIYRSLAGNRSPEVSAKEA